MAPEAGWAAATAEGAGLGGEDVQVPFLVDGAGVVYVSRVQWLSSRLYPASDGTLRARLKDPLWQAGRPTAARGRLRWGAGAGRSAGSQGLAPPRPGIGAGHDPS